MFLVCAFRLEVERARTSWCSAGNTAPEKTPSTLKKALRSHSHKSLQPVSTAETSAQIRHFKILFGGWRKVSVRPHRSSGRARVRFHSTYIQRKTKQNKTPGVRTSGVVLTLEKHTQDLSISLATYPIPLPNARFNGDTASK